MTAYSFPKWLYFATADKYDRVDIRWSDVNGLVGQWTQRWILSTITAETTLPLRHTQLHNTLASTSEVFLWALQVEYEVRGMFFIFPLFRR